MFWLKYIQGLVKAFHGDESPNQLAAGFAIGAIIGLVPKLGLMGFLLWCVVLFFRVHFGMATAAARKKCARSFHSFTASPPRRSQASCTSAVA